MKVVINRCYGGFSLSPKGLERYMKLKRKKIYFFDYQGNKTTAKKLGKDLFFSAYTTKDQKEGTYVSSRPEDRADPKLIQVVEEMGEEANGQCAKLAIVEIPDNIQWEIDEYDGVERIVEKHNSWY